VRVAAFTKYGRAAASTRQRLLQYLPRLREAGIEVDFHPLLDDDYVRSLATGERFSHLEVIRSYARRMTELAQRPDCDVVWIYAELFPYLPAAFERLAFRAGKPVVYDFDDAFFLAYEDKPLLSGKLEPLLKGAALCCCGNDYLRDHALRFTARAIVLPTVVDTDQYRPMADQPDRVVTVGWIGTPSTWAYVHSHLPLLREICSERGVRLLVVGAGKAAEADLFAGMELRDWREEREVADVQSMDIGIMPLPDEPWARGKSGYKLIQYMACGLPVIASPVGANATIVDHGKTGLLAGDASGWRAAFGSLLADRDLRARMGLAGREKAVRDYSLQSQAPRLIEVLTGAARSG
jgi:glycosyltransferase involved in cell wall biosynthesis